jgi:hypothetical protein
MTQSINKIEVLAPLSFLLFLLSCGIGMGPVLAKTSLVVEALPVRLDPDDPGRKRFGRLTFLAGFELKAEDSRFGGLSGLALSSDGDMLYAVSDRGYWLSATMIHASDGRLKELGPWEIGPLLAPGNVPVSGRLRDAEALVRDRDGSFLVSFEKIHRLWRYPASPALFGSLPKHIPTPADLGEAPGNGGLEGITVLADGRLLLFTEQYENPDGSFKGWIFENGRFEPLSYSTSDGFQPTDLAALASGDVLVLERRYNLIGSPATRIQLVSRESLQPGARLKGKEIIRIERPLVVDNFEGMAVREDPQLGTFIYLISDDNYNPFQQTLLLQFRLDTASRN